MSTVAAFVPVGAVGDWRVERFSVSESDAKMTAMRAAFQGGRGYVPPGEYTSLRERGSLWMSDTPDEVRDHHAPIYWAGKRGGHVLICGLGIGVVLSGVLAHPNVEHVTVIERSPEVVALVGAHYLALHPGRLTIIEADALTYKPKRGERYSVAWFDIWLHICGDNVPEMRALMRRWSRRAEWRGCWAYREALRRR